MGKIRRLKDSPLFASRTFTALVIFGQKNWAALFRWLAYQLAYSTLNVDFKLMPIEAQSDSDSNFFFNSETAFTLIAVENQKLTNLMTKN